MAADEVDAADRTTDDESHLWLTWLSCSSDQRHELETHGMRVGADSDRTRALRLGGIGPSVHSVGGHMEALVAAAGFVSVLIVLLGVATLVKPFWFIRKRWQAGLMMFAGLMAGGFINAVPLKRPVEISQADWAERVRVCAEANEIRECPLKEADVEKARLKVAEATRKAAADAEIKTAENRAKEAEKLARARERELEATASAMEGGTAKINDTTQQQLWISATERAVKGHMKDPGSVRFRNSRFTAYQGRTPVVCGEVNAKNGFGGRTGYQKFIASGETFGPYLEETTPAGEFAKAWNELCV